MIYVNRVYFYVEGINPTNKWEVVKTFELFFAPLAINITQHLYDFMIEFFISKESGKSNQNSFVEKDFMESMRAKVGFE